MAGSEREGGGGGKKEGMLDGVRGGGDVTELG